MGGGISFTVIANPNEKLRKVLNKFKETQCPEIFKNKISYILSKGDILDNNKTITQNNLKKNDICLLITNKDDGTITDEDLEKTDTNDLVPEEIEQLKRRVKEYKKKNFKDLYEKMENNDIKDDKFK